MLGAMTALFVILSQLTYPILLAIYYWCKPGDENKPLDTDPSFDSFSSAYTAIGLYFLLIAICSKQNLGVFIRLGSLGAIFVSMFVLAIVTIGAWGIHTTEY
mmetsp:Transcript_1525/g.2095  ORF Transcript_1525/g.2095 Transcript_1525/m.2095 type:complete len:102 (-) Transcript_1525:1236-1541(-)